jgi:hypothetical protein
MSANSFPIISNILGSNENSTKILNFTLPDFSTLLEANNYLTRDGLMCTISGEIYIKKNSATIVKLADIDFLYANYIKKSTINSGVVSLPIVHVNVNYNISLQDYTILGDSTSSQLIFTLPSASNVGTIYNIKKIDTSINRIVIITVNNEKIDSLTQKTLKTSNETFTIQSDGSNWFVI